MGCHKISWKPQTTPSCSPGREDALDHASVLSCKDVSNHSSALLDALDYSLHGQSFRLAYVDT